MNLLQIYFYNTSSEKKRMTKTLGSAVLTRDGVFLPGGTVQKPSFNVAVSASDLVGINYAYVPDFGRYYFVSEKTFVGSGIWAITLNVDPLTSFRTNILNSSAYVLRTSNPSMYNEELTDGFYPVIQGANITRLQASNLADWSPGDDAFNGESGRRYILSANISNFLVGNTAYESKTGVTIGMMTENALPKVLDDAFFGNSAPAVYPDRIRDIFWIPVEPENDGRDYDGWGIATFLQGESVRSVTAMMKTVTFTIDLSSIRTDTYKDLGPFRAFHLIFQPFGVLPLDSSVLYKQDTLKIRVRVNCYSGAAFLSYGVGSSPLYYRPISSASVKISTMIAGTQSVGQWVASNLIPFGASSYSSVIGGMQQPSQLGAASAAVGILSGAYNAITNYAGVTYSTNGAINPIVDGYPTLLVYDYPQAARDLQKYGAPSCVSTSLNSFASGDFVKCGEVDLIPDGMEEAEIDAVTNMLKEGIYI